MSLTSIDPRRLLVFRSAARAGSISAAARELGWTQPAVSQHLAALERAAGCPLLLRGPGGVTPTDPGRALLARADRVALELRLAEEELSATGRLQRGTVRLAAFPSACAVLVPRVLAGLTSYAPGVDVLVRELEPPEALAEVLDDEADLAITFHHEPDGGPPVPEGLQTSPVFREPVQLVVPTGHRLAGRRPVKVADLAQEAWIAGCERCRSHLLQVCHRAGFEPRIRHTTDDQLVVQHLVAQGLGITLLPRTALQAYRHPDVAVRSCADLGERQVEVVHRSGAEAVPATGAVLAAIVASARTEWPHRQPIG